MGSTLNFTFLALAILSFFHNAHASPLSRRHQTLTLPLRRIHERGDTHPEIQHINRGHIRFARMTGSEAPSEKDMTDTMRKRMDDIRLSPMHKRYAPMVGSGSVHFISLLGNVTDPVTDSQSGGNPGFSQAEIDSMQDGHGITEGKAPTACNSLSLDIVGPDIGYTATFQVGNPPRDFRLIMDSGSADFWIGQEGCVNEKTGGSCGNHTFLSEDKSSTLNLTDEPWNITYGLGHVSGFLVSDDVSIAGLSLPGHKFGVAANESDNFASDSRFDGLVGLAMSGGSNQGFLTPVEALAEEGYIDEAITAYKISRVFDETNDGEITFGGLDPSKFDASTLVEMDNHSDVFWTAPMDNVVVNDSDLQMNRSVILDTGTTLLAVPVADAKAIHGALNGAASYDQEKGVDFVLPCNTNDTVKLYFSGQAFNIASEDIAFIPVDINNKTGMCHSGIVGSNIFTDGRWLAGDTFLKSVYFVTNVDKKQISLAKNI